MLDRRMRQSWPARVTAVGFIIVILFGNLWLVHAMTGAMTPEWIEGGFGVGTLLAVCGGVGLGGLAVLLRLRGETDDGAGVDGDGSGADGDGGDEGEARASPPSVGG